MVDDDDAVRRSTAGLLRGAGHRVESFTSGSEFLASDSSKDLACVLLDLRMPGVDGLAVMRKLSERGAMLPVVVLTGHGDIPLAVEAMKLGAADFLEKPYAPAALLATIDRVCSELAPVPGARPVNKQAQAKVASLTERQRAVLLGVLKGQPSKIIAWELGLSIRTVEAYRAQILIKLGVNGTVEAVRLALAAGMDLSPSPAIP
ncbi:MAG: response regulator [Devosia sp.]